ncbi:MAG TPA: DUF2330 domain-containing protein [Polyangiaceae bacterium]|nr:DUF2330 domain-containing protein [Polyangiaceae bacterium]
MTIKHALRLGSVAASLALGALACPNEAEACGGFFCDSNQPINQAAERIIFAHNADGTVTAVIQILYEGPAENFSWVLPISTVPTQEQGIGIASDIAFQRLQRATNPSYTLTTRIEGTCGETLVSSGGSSSGGATSGPTAGNPSPGDGGVVVEASGSVGPFEWVAISLNQSLDDPSDAAVDWLTEKGYDVAPGARGLLRPYLEDGLYLLALRLTKDADTGSIRPIKLTYEATKPMIPIKLTAVAANADMGVMTWILSSARAVPSNYNALELNEARINWFNPATNYDDVVSAAADESGGQGFVTEFAGPSEALGKPVWSDNDELQWSTFKTIRFANFRQILETSESQWGTWDGFWDALRTSVVLPAHVAAADFKLCPGCYADEVQFSPTQYIAALETNVIAPVRDVQTLLDDHAYTTRFYTTMSADEMTVDPAFTFNRDLPNVDNQHTAERVIECNSKVNQFNAPWRVALPQGVTVRGRGNSWPGDDVEQPANARILRLAESGEGQVLEDNSQVITAKLKEYNAPFGTPPVGAGGSTNGGSTNGGSTNGGSTGGTPVTAGGDTGSAANGATPEGTHVSGGCNTVAGTPASGGWLLSLSGLALVIAARRRRRE